MNSKLKKYFILFLYIVLNIFFIVATVSVASFFHFNLDHSLNTIQNWVYHHNWEIFILAKIISFLIIYRILDVYSLNSVKTFSRNKKNINIRVYVISFSSFLFLLFSANPVLNNQFEFSKILISSFGNIFVTILDTWFFFIVLKKESVTRIAVIISFTQILFFTILFKIGLHVHISNVASNILNYIFLIYLFKLNKNINEVIIYLVIFLLPIKLILGLDTFWNNEFSLLTSQNEINITHHVVAIIGSLVYITYFKKAVIKEI